MGEVKMGGRRSDRNEGGMHLGSFPDHQAEFLSEMKERQAFSHMMRLRTSQGSQISRDS